MNVSADARGDQRRVSDTLDWKSHVVVNCLTWVLGTENLLLGQNILNCVVFP